MRHIFHQGYWLPSLPVPSLYAPSTLSCQYLRPRWIGMLCMTVSAHQLDYLLSNQLDPFPTSGKLPALKPTAANISWSSVGPVGMSCRRSWRRTFPTAALRPGPFVFTSSYSLVRGLQNPHEVHLSTTLENSLQGSKSTRSQFISSHVFISWWGLEH